MDSKKTIYLWGAGNAEGDIRALVLPDVRIKGIVDINAKKIKEKNGIRVILPDELGDFDAMVITAKSPYSIRKTYLDLELPEEKLIIPWEKVLHGSVFLDENKWTMLLKNDDTIREKNRKLNAPFEKGPIFPVIYSANSLLEDVITNHKSMCRFGDGEFEIMRMKDRAWFQQANEQLANRLKEIIVSKRDNMCLCIADNFSSLDKFTDEAADDIRDYMTSEGTRADILYFLSKDVNYYDAYVTRPYILYKDKHHAEKIFGLWKKLFQERNILLVEGMHACSGKGNDLFFGCNSIKNIICPDENAFDQYDEIMNHIIETAEKDALILLRLGPTATVMAYDLSLLGYQAIDFGQLDNEYDWYRMGAKTRQLIPGKLVAELSRG